MAHSWGFWVRVGDIPFLVVELVTLVSHFGVLGLATFEGYDIILAEFKFLIKSTR
jgi:hypothetical protein